MDAINNNGKLILKLGKFAFGEGDKKVQIENAEIDLSSMFSDDSNANNNSTAIQMTKMLLDTFGPSLVKAIDVSCKREERYAEQHAKESAARLESHLAYEKQQIAESKARVETEKARAAKYAMEEKVQFEEHIAKSAGKKS